MMDLFRKDKEVEQIFYILIIALVLFIALIIGIKILLSPIFWIILGLVIIVYHFANYMDKKSKGFIASTLGYVTLDGVNPSKVAVIYLYPNKITVNDIQFIPINRVLNASFKKTTKVVKGYKDDTKNHTHFLTIHYSDKDGKLSSFTCTSRLNNIVLNVNYEKMKRKINMQVGYIPPRVTYPDKSYEL
jgi:uncharacterized membrane protein